MDAYRTQLHVLLVLSVALFLVPFSALAQTAQLKDTITAAKAVTIATVNIQNAKIISQEGNTLRIAFDLTNREGIQTGVRYAVQLIASTTKGQFLADEKVYPGTLTLAEHSSAHQDITYTAPPSLSVTSILLPFPPI